MSLRWTADDITRVNKRLQQAIEAPLAPILMPVKRPKYGNSKVQWQGYTFDSKKECEDFKSFEIQRIAGAIRSVIRQVSFQLPGTLHRIRVDFLVVENDGTHRWFDSKGFETEAWRNKREQVKTAFGIEIQLI